MRRIAAGIVLAVVAALPAPAAAKRYYTSLSGGTHAFDPPQVTIGESATLPIQARCLDSKTGTYVNDTVTLYVVHGPSAARFVAPVPTTRSSDPTQWPRATYQTTPYTPPGVYAGSPDKVVKFKGVGKICGIYAANTSSTGYIVVAPRLVVKGDFWWFNGHLDDNPDYEPVELTAYPPGRTYTFSVVYGTRYAEIHDGDRHARVVRTANRKVSLTDRRLAWKADPAAGRYWSTSNYPFDLYDVGVTVTVNGASASLHAVPMRYPFDIQLLSAAEASKKLGHPTANPSDAPSVAFGHVSTLYYRIVDQYGEQLPHPVWARENFFFPYSAEKYDIPYLKRPTSVKNNWTIGSNGDHASKNRVDPGFFRDMIAGQSVVLKSPFPVPSGPETPLGDLDMGYWKGSVTVGSTEKFEGVLVARLVWQKYRDHARHCDVVSPLTEKTPARPCPPGTR